VPSYNPARRVNQHRVRPAPLLHARRKLRDLSLGMRPGILRIRDQPVDRPALNLIRGPCRLARALCAQARASDLGNLPSWPPAQAGADLPTYRASGMFETACG
jgi:hypothetical protein